jgi:hypothetical protein
MTPPQPDADQGESSRLPAGPTCPTCLTALGDEQEWCLNCGQARPGRTPRVPGRRAAATVMALTSLLVGGAVAASYAALDDGSGAAPAPAAAQVAQVAPAPPVASTPTPPPVASTPAPAATTDPATDTVAADTGDSATDDTDAAGGSDRRASIRTSTPRTTSTHRTTASPAPARTRTTTKAPADEPKAIALGDDAVALYDPYHRDLAIDPSSTTTASTTDPSSTDPTAPAIVPVVADPDELAKAHDDDDATSFALTVPDGSPGISSGLVVDLGTARGVRELDLSTDTPGFRIEVYATDSEELPPDVLDTRWAHLKNATITKTVDEGAQKLTLGAGSSKYRHLLVWFTTPPAEGMTVRVAELAVLG